MLLSGNASFKSVFKSLRHLLQTYISEILNTRIRWDQLLQTSFVYNKIVEEGTVVKIESKQKICIFVDRV